MLLPESCSVRVDGDPCRLAPSFVVSVMADQGEYMVAVVCGDHQSALRRRIEMMQADGSLPAGRLKFDPIKTVTTDCVVGSEQDYVDVELTRGISSDKKIT